MVHVRARMGLVVDSMGRPVAEALVSVVCGTAPTSDIAARTGKDGAFRLALPAGRFRLRAYAPGGASGEVEITSGEEEQFTVRVTQGSVP